MFEQELSEASSASKVKTENCILTGSSKAWIDWTGKVKVLAWLVATKSLESALSTKVTWIKSAFSNWFVSSYSIVQLKALDGADQKTQFHENQLTHVRTGESDGEGSISWDVSLIIPEISSWKDLCQRCSSGSKTYSEISVDCKLRHWVGVAGWVDRDN